MSMIEFKDVEKYYGDFHALKISTLKLKLVRSLFCLVPQDQVSQLLIRTAMVWNQFRRTIDC